MKKKSFTLLLAMLLIFSMLFALFTGCSKEEPKVPTTEPTTESADEPDEPDDLHNYMLEGEWLYSDGGISITFDGLGSFVLETEDEYISGTYEYDGETLWMETEDSIETGYIDDDEDLIIDDMEGYFYYNDTSVSYDEPYFEENGYVFDLEMDGGRVELPGGGAYYREDGSAYITTTNEWALVSSEDSFVNDNGVKAIFFDAYVYFPSANNPMLSGDHLYSYAWDLFDYYTGYLLPTSANFGDGGDSFVYEFYSEDELIRVEIGYTVEYTANVGSDSYVAFMEFWATMPEDYDGLVFAATACPDTLDDFYEVQNERDVISDYKVIDDLDYIPYLEKLLCRIY